MNFIGFFRTWWDMFTLNPAGYVKAKELAGWAVVLLVLVISVYGAVMGEFFSYFVSSFFGTPYEFMTLAFIFVVVLAPVFYLFTVLAFWLGARVLGGKARYWHHFKAWVIMSTISVLLAMSVIGLLVSWLYSIWTIVMGVNFVRHAHGLSTGAAIGSGFLGVLFISLAWLVIVTIFVVLGLLAAVLLAA